MATILREATQTQYYRRAYNQVDPVPNLPAGFFSNVPPFRNQSTLPDRFWPRPPVQDYQQNSTFVLGIATQPRDPRIFRTPTIVPIWRKPYQQEEPVQTNLVLKTLVTVAAPFTIEQFPETFRGRFPDFGFEAQSFLPGPGQLPFFPADFPNPVRARTTPQDFIFSSSGIPPQAPFNQDDWPVPLKLRLHHQDFWWTGVTTRGIPAGVAIPFNQDEWPVPVRARSAQSDSYASPHILLITPVLRPFTQSDWHNPSRFRPITIDWPWGGVTTRGIPPVPPPSGPFDAVRLEIYDIGLNAVELHWSASLGAFGYRLYIDGIQQPTVLHQRIIVVTGLAIDTPYTFNVVCVNAFGADASDLSNTLQWGHGSNEITTVN